MESAQIAADVFGNALGNSIVDGMAPRSQTVPGLDETRARNEAELLAMPMPTLTTDEDIRQQRFQMSVEQDIRQELFQASVQRNIELSLSNNPGFSVNLPVPTAKFEDDIFGGTNPFAGARLTPTIRDAVMEYDARVLRAIDATANTADAGAEWNSLLTEARLSGKSMDQVSADRKRATALAALAVPSDLERAGIYDVQKELQWRLLNTPEPPRYPIDTRGVAMSAWDPAQTRREQLGWAAIEAIESNPFAAGGYLVGNVVTDPDQAAVVALRSGVAGNAFLSLASARLAKVDFRAMSLPADQAAAWQGSGLYPGVDRYRNITLQPGTYVVGAAPGQGNYYTTMSGLARSGGDVVRYYQGTQVAPNLTNPARDIVRDGLMIYRVGELTPAAFGITRANPQYGSGGLPQLYVPDYSRLTPVQFVPFQNKIPEIKPVEISR